MPIIDKYRRDWWQILTDLSYAGYSLSQIADEIGVPKGTITSWKVGHQPSYDSGAALLYVWSVVTGRGVEDSPCELVSRSFIPTARLNARRDLIEDAADQNCANNPRPHRRPAEIHV